MRGLSAPRGSPAPATDRIPRPASRPSEHASKASAPRKGLVPISRIRSALGVRALRNRPIASNGFVGACDEGVEAFDELVVALGFADPASLFGVVGEGFGVDALDGEDG